MINSKFNDYFWKEQRKLEWRRAGEPGGPGAHGPPFPACRLEGQATDQAREPVDGGCSVTRDPSRSPSRKGPGFQAGCRVTPAAIKKAPATLKSVTTCMLVICLRLRLPTWRDHRHPHSKWWRKTCWC